MTFPRPSGEQPPVARLRDLMRTLHNDHGGAGSLQAYRAYDRTRSTSVIAFIDLVSLPPGSSIGLHRHGDEQETYVVLRGGGLMTLDVAEFRVGPGDLIRNRERGSHGLVNDGADDLELLVFEAVPAQRGAS